MGAGGAALQVWALLKDLGDRTDEVGGFVIAHPPSFDVEGLAVQSEQDFLALADPGREHVVIAIGDPVQREAVAGRYAAAGFRAPTLVHPSALIGPHVSIGAGCIVLAHAILETHIHLGEHVLVNLAAVISHENRIGSFTNVGPRSCLAGGVVVGRRCDLGAGVTIRPRIELADDMVVGAGAVVVRNRNTACTLVGNPATPLGEKRP